MAYKVCFGNRQAPRLRKSNGHRLITYQANGSRVVDGGNPYGLGGLQNGQARPLRDGLQHIGVVFRQRKIGQAGDCSIGLEYLDLVPPLRQLVRHHHRHRLASVSLLYDKAEAHRISLQSMSACQISLAAIVSLVYRLFPPQESSCFTKSRLPTSHSSARLRRIPTLPQRYFGEAPLTTFSPGSSSQKNGILSLCRD